MTGVLFLTCYKYMINFCFGDSTAAQSSAHCDPATVTCKEYNSSNHQGMVDISAALYKASRNEGAIFCDLADRPDNE